MYWFTTVYWFTAALFTGVPRGEAEAYAIEVKAKAEAEQMAKKADAWKEYQEAALVDMMLKVMVTRVIMMIMMMMIKGRLEANLFIYQARESSLVPTGFLTAQFPQKT